jgi:hypothetical protein
MPAVPGVPTAAERLVEVAANQVMGGHGMERG